jgi:CRP/FNR family transcriptional activator FtrB
MRDIDVDRLRSIPLLRELAEPELWKLREHASVRDAAAQTELFRERDTPRLLHALIFGAVELFCEYQNRRCTISVIRCDKPFVLASVVHGRHMTSGRTIEPSRLVCLPAGLVRKLLDTDLGFARASARQLAEEHEDIIGDVKGLRMRTTIERLADWILRSNEEAGGTGHFAIPFDKRTLAAYLGMAPENLSRNLAVLAASGVEVRGRRVVIGNPLALAEIAGAKSPARPVHMESIADAP